MKRGPIYRDGKVHVAAKLCKTCIFRRGNLMSLRPGRVEQMVREAQARESCIVCHETLGASEAVCAGFYKRHATAPLQIAARMGAIAFEGKQ